MCGTQKSPSTAQIQSAHAHPTLAHRSYFRKSEIKDGWRSSYKRSRAIVISNKNSPSAFFFFFFLKPHKNPHNYRESVKYTGETKLKPFPIPARTVRNSSPPPSVCPPSPPPPAPPPKGGFGVPLP